MIAAALIVLALAQPVGSFLVFRYLAGRDASERVEREALLVRVQAPQVAAMQDALGVPVVQGAHLAWDDDKAWMDHVSGADASR